MNLYTYNNFKYDIHMYSKHIIPSCLLFCQRKKIINHNLPRVRPSCFWLCLLLVSLKKNFFVNQSVCLLDPPTMAAPDGLWRLFLQNPISLLFDRGNRWLTYTSGLRHNDAFLLTSFLCCSPRCIVLDVNTLSWSKTRLHIPSSERQLTFVSPIVKSVSSVCSPYILQKII